MDQIPANLIAIKKEGNDLYAAKQYREAHEKYLQVYEQVLNETSSEMVQLKVSVQSNLAATSLKLQEWSNAVEYCTKVLEVEPDNVKAIFRRGVAYRALKEFDMAKRDLALAISKDPSDLNVVKELEAVIREAKEHTPLQPKSSSLLDTYGEDGQIPRLRHDDPRALELMKNEYAVILTGLPLIDSAIQKWNVQYLADNMPDPEITVFENKFDNQFMYFEESKNVAKYDFIPKTRQLKMSFKEFLAKAEPAEEAERTKSSVRYYLQQGLHQEGVSQNIIEDFKKFDWNWIHAMQAALDIGPMKTNSLWVGMEGVVTPSHFDEAHNFFGQVSGRKKFILHHPKNFPNMYPFPLHHPCDRQCQENPDYERFPRFKDAKAVEGIVGPGDVLYLPGYWFHYVKSLDKTISVNFWLYLKNDKGNIELPLKKHSQIMAFRRNIEKYIGDAMGPNHVGQFLDELYSGRFQTTK